MGHGIVKLISDWRFVKEDDGRILTNHLHLKVL